MDEQHLDTPEEAVSAQSETPKKPQQVIGVKSPRSRRARWLPGLLILVAFIVGVGGTILYEQEQVQNNQPITQLSKPKNDGNTVVTKQEADIAGVAEKVAPSVVSILTKSQAASFQGVLEQDGAGTGIILSKDGYILTNKHVVAGADTVTVVTSDGTSYDNVKVVGTDPLNDIAFVKIDGVSNLTPAELGDSTSVRIGQSVVAIGNALGQYQNTVTSGIISGLNRSVTAGLESGSSDTETLTDLIQTDASINPGNSGGPLVNLAGQVIGINTAIASDANGIGFVIPISSTKGVIQGVLDHGTVARAYLGVQYLNVTADVAKTYNLPVQSGAYIFNPNGGSAVVSGSPADKAGLQDKDIITQVNDTKIGTAGSVSSLIGQFQPGDTVQLTYIRGGHTATVKVTLGTYKG